MNQKVRLDKFLADRGLGTRSEVKEGIRRGKVLVNKETARRPEMKIDPVLDGVEYCGAQVGFQSYDYFMFHKPAGLLSATRDPKTRTVLDAMREAADGKETVKWDSLFPVGRLDKDAEGLLLITNDGELAHRLLSPKNHVPKTYYVLVEGWLDEAARKEFAKGLSLSEGETALPARLKILSVNSSPSGRPAPLRTFPQLLGGEGLSEAELTIYEGKFHQVKRMFEAVGMKVKYLKRLSMGSLALDKTLEKGDYRRLTPEETADLLSHKKPDR